MCAVGLEVTGKMFDKTIPELQTLTIQQAIDLAHEYYNAGRLPDAENIYQQILQADPNQPDALHLLGVIAYLTGKSEFAVDLIPKSLAVKPSSAEAHCNLGVVQERQAFLAWRGVGMTL